MAWLAAWSAGWVTSLLCLLREEKLRRNMGRRGGPGADLSGDVFGRGNHEPATAIHAARRGQPRR